MILNTHDQLTVAGGGVAITRRAGNGRACVNPAFQVYRVNAAGKQLMTDPEAAWYDNFCKTFTFIGRPDVKAALEAAKAWCAARYKLEGPWVRNRIGDYVTESMNGHYPISRERPSGGGIRKPGLQ